MNFLRRSLRNLFYENYAYRKRYNINKEENKYVRELFKKGYCVIENYWTPEKAELYKNKLESLVFNGTKNIDLDSGAYIRWKKNIKDQTEDYGVVRAYHVEKELEELTNMKEDSFINNIINAYYGYNMYPAYIVYQHNFVSENVTRGYHIDGFTDEFKAFLYLEDVNEGNGPFSYLSGSHKSYAKRWQRMTSKTNPSTAFLEQDLEQEMKNECKICAGAGALILADTVGFHRGMPQTSNSRSIIYNNYFPKKQLLYPEK